MEKYEFDNVIIGAGVIGLALGVQLSKLGNQVLIIEKKNRPGEEISSRNSGLKIIGTFAMLPSKRPTSTICR